MHRKNSLNSRRRFLAQWLARSRSAVFMGTLLSVAIAFLSLGIWQQSAGSALLAGLLFQLSGALLAASVGTLFFSFPDIREQLSSSMAALFSNVDIADTLSEETRNRLYTKLMQIRVGDKAAYLDDSLVLHLKSMNDDCHGMIHLYNYHFHVVYMADPLGDDIALFETLISFRASAHHLLEGTATFPYRFIQEISVPPRSKINPENLLLEFDACFGNQHHTIADVIKENKEVEGNSILFFKFEKTVTINGEADIRIRYKCRNKLVDNCCNILVRYPTRGFSVSFIYTNDFDYDCRWFKSGDPDYQHFPGTQETHRLENGMNVVTNDWVLPGEGISINWTPKLLKQKGW